MPPIHHQRSDPAPGIDASELLIPDEQDLGTGTVTITISPNSLRADSLIVSSFTNPSLLFDISATFNGDRKVVVILGRSRETDAISQVCFSLPPYFRRNEAHTVAITFSKWAVFSATFDGNQLKEAAMPPHH